MICLYNFCTYNLWLILLLEKQRVSGLWDGHPDEPRAHPEPQSRHGCSRVAVRWTVWYSFRTWLLSSLSPLSFIKLKSQDTVGIKRLFQYIRLPWQTEILGPEGLVPALVREACFPFSLHPTSQSCRGEWGAKEGHVTSVQLHWLETKTGQEIQCTGFWEKFEVKLSIKRFIC